MKTFNQEQLKQYNGQDGQPIYIAVGDKVYDVSGSKLWRGGMHMKRHPAGQDLTSDIQAAPHTREVLERYPQIGVLEKEADEAQGAAPGQEIPPWLAGLLEKVPMLRRHPHPMTVHFPIAFMFAVPVFSFLYL
ncbi:MAG: cytochrome b5 domain-containing protein, partial [Desulfosarcinaceae bacterium]